MRSDRGIWILICVMLFIMIGGGPLLGRMLFFVLEIAGFFVLLALISMLLFRHRVRRAQRQAQERGEEFSGYTWHFGGYQNTTRPDPNGRAEVKVEGQPKSKKRVSDNVGEYVDFDEK